MSSCNNAIWSTHKNIYVQFFFCPLHCCTHSLMHMKSAQEILHHWMPYYFKISLKLNSMKCKIHRSLKPCLSVILQHLVPLWALEFSCSLRWLVSCNLLEEWVSPLSLKRRKPALKTEKGKIKAWIEFSRLSENLLALGVELSFTRAENKLFPNESILCRRSGERTG